MTPDKQELKPCPWCGLPPEISRGNNGAEGETFDVAVECKNPDCGVSCGYVAFDVSNNDEAIEAWNTRSAPCTHANTTESDLQKSLDALGRLSCAALAKDSPLREQIVKTELANFLKYTDVIHELLFDALNGTRANTAAVEVIKRSTLESQFFMHFVNQGFTLSSDAMAGACMAFNYIQKKENGLKIIAENTEKGKR